MQIQSLFFMLQLNPNVDYSRILIKPLHDIGELFNFLKIIYYYTLILAFKKIIYNNSVLLSL